MEGFSSLNIGRQRRRHFCRRPGIPSLVLSVSGCCCRRESVPPQTTRPLRRTEDQAAARYRLHSLYSRPSLPFLRLAERPHRRQTRYTDSVASQRVPIVLEVEVATG